MWSSKAGKTSKRWKKSKQWMPLRGIWRRDCLERSRRGFYVWWNGFISWWVCAFIKTHPWRVHNTMHSWCVIELYTWNLYHFINQCHPNKFNLKTHPVIHSRFVHFTINRLYFYPTPQKKHEIWTLKIMSAEVFKVRWGL